MVRQPRLRGVALVLGVALTTGIIAVTSGGRRTELPVKALSSAPAPVTAQRCAACHAQECEDFESAPHGQTLWRGDDQKVIARFAGKNFQTRSPDMQYHFENRKGELWVHSDAYPDALRVDWVFGTGRHAQTPVSVWTNPAGETELLEHRVSWYPGAGLDLTLGAQHSAQVRPGIDALGRPQEHAETMGCFGCHTTYLPTKNGQIEFAKVIAGVSCARCHPGTVEHAASPSTGEIAEHRWSDLSPLASINRCGECHRRADQLTRDELVPGNRDLPRFASVALSQSPCFQKQDLVQGLEGNKSRLDCMTCHHPHRTAETDPAFYVARCLNCHGSQPHQVRPCRSQPQTSACLDCHMPKVKAQSHLQFTDHWIRVRDPK